MKIGKIVSINYSQLKVKISSDIKGSSVNLFGSVYYFGNIGSYLKVTNAVDEIIVCEVISIFDSDMTKEKFSFDMDSNRELLIRPIGTIDNKKKFNLGVGIFPTLYSDVSIVTYDDMKIILNVKDDNDGSNIHESFSLGVSKNLINYAVDINIDNFFNIHSAILGNSGSGKSNTIAHIVQKVYAKTQYSAIGSRILIYDVNGEYKQAFSNDMNSNISVKYLKPNMQEREDGFESFVLPHFLLTLDEWSAFLLATDATQRPFWSKVLQESYRFYKIGTSTPEEQDKFVNYLKFRVCELVYSALRQADTDTARITTAASMLGSILSILQSDTVLSQAAENLISDIQDLQRACVINYGANENQLQSATDRIAKTINQEYVQEIMSQRIKNEEYFDYKFLKIAAELILLEEDSRGNKQIRSYTATMLTRLDYFIENSDCHFMREHNSNIKNKDEYLKWLWGEGGNKTQVIIIDTSELAPDILETLTGVVSRLLFDSRKILVGEERRKKPIHLILDEAHRYIKKNYDYILKENIFEKIAREGRKYSLYLLVSSQRPSELSETVLSQCANFIVHRIQNEKDMLYIKAILPYFSDDYTNKIKQSIPGEALIFGNCVSMPLHLKIHKASPNPDSANCKISEEWFIE